MQPEREEEEDQRKRILVDPQHPPATSHRPRHVLAHSGVPRIPIHRHGLVEFLGFGRTLLEQEGSQPDIESHLQELALPVLRRYFQEVAGKEVLVQDEGIPAVFDLILVVLAESREALSEQAGQKQRQHGE